MKGILESGLTRAFVGGNLLLAATVAFALVRPVSSPNVVTKPLDTRVFQSQASGSAGAGGQDRAVASLADRPLFIEGRKLVASAAIVPVTQAPKPERPALSALQGLSLLGIVVVGDQRRALVKDASWNDAKQIGVDDDLFGWHVIRVERDTLILSNGADEHRLTFRALPENGVHIGTP